MLYSVGRRRREMGIRLAMGARKTQVTEMVLRDGMGLAAKGLGLGVLAALAVTRLLSSLVWGVTLTDVRTYAAVCGLLGAVVLVASWVPARKASRTDLVETLKTE